MLNYKALVKGFEIQKEEHEQIKQQRDYYKEEFDKVAHINDLFESKTRILKQSDQQISQLY